MTKRPQSKYILAQYLCFVVDEGEAMSRPAQAQNDTAEVEIKSGVVMMEGELTVPRGARGVVLFAHGSGGGAPRGRVVSTAFEQIARS